MAKYRNNDMKQNSRYIEICDVYASNNKLKVRLNLSKDMEKYLTSKNFIAEYSKNIEKVNNSILGIPVLSAVVTIAWATGADVFIEEVDKDYLDSLNKIRPLFKRWFPSFSFSTKIYPRKLVSNESNGKNVTLLFSGGVDSLVSWIRNKEKISSLISIWGLDIPTYNPTLWNMAKRAITDFARREGIQVHFIKTNAREMINDKALSKDYRVDGWWGRVCHGLITLGLCAPLTQMENIGQVIIASTHTTDFAEPWGSDPSIDNNISWAGIKVIHDGYELSRQQKIKILREFPQYLPYLRSCMIDYHCGHCMKCLINIVALVLEDIDPKSCNLYVNEKTFDFIRRLLSKRLLSLNSEWIFFWEDIQRHIPNELPEKLYNSKKFFEWLKKFDFSDYKPRQGILPRIFKLYWLGKYRGFSYIMRYFLKRSLLNLKGLFGGKRLWQR